MEAFPELWREASICGCLVGEECVASGSWSVEQVQEGCARWLFLIGDVRVPGNRIRPLFEKVSRGCVIGSTVDEMNLWVAFRSAGCGMNVVASEVAADVQSFPDVQVGKVLVAEGHDLLLGHKQCELIFTSIGQLAQLYTMDLSTDISGNIVNFGIFQEIGKRWIRVFAMLLMLECI
jgi:hypothetical protein